jgi:F0F1-type ATP synthase epsilon subunit
MIKCKNQCPEGKFSGCCIECPEKEGCASVCEETPDKCGSSFTEAAPDNSAAIASFQAGQLTVLQQIADLVTTKKNLEDQEKKLKVQLQTAMEAYGIKKFTSDILTITYVAATTASTIDSAKLKKNYPAIAEECSKPSSKAAYVKVEVK